MISPSKYYGNPDINRYGYAPYYPPSNYDPYHSSRPPIQVCERKPEVKQPIIQKKPVKKTNTTPSLSPYYIVGGISLAIIILIIIIYFIFFQNDEGSNVGTLNNIIDSSVPTPKNNELILIPKSEEIEYVDEDTGEVIMPSQMKDYVIVSN